MKVIRLTRHTMEAAQEAVLREKFGQDVEIITISETLPGDPKAAVARFDEIAAGASVVEVVLPIGLLEAVLKFSAFSRTGGHIIRAVMDRQIGPDGGAIFTFDHYERVVKVEVVTEPL